jgi:hypothetical protein
MKPRAPPIWCCIPWERGEIAAKLGITRKQLRTFEAAGFYRLRKITREAHVIAIEGFPPDLALAFNTPTRAKPIQPDPTRSKPA